MSRRDSMQLRARAERGVIRFLPLPLYQKTTAHCQSYTKNPIRNLTKHQRLITSSLFCSCYYLRRLQMYRLACPMSDGQPH